MYICIYIHTIKKHHSQSEKTSPKQEQCICSVCSTQRTQTACEQAAEKWAEDKTWRINRRGRARQQMRMLPPQPRGRPEGGHARSRVPPSGFPTQSCRQDTQGTEGQATWPHRRKAVGFLGGGGLPAYASLCCPPQQSGAHAAL